MQATIQIKSYLFKIICFGQTAIENQYDDNIFIAERKTRKRQRDATMKKLRRAVWGLQYLKEKVGEKYAEVLQNPKLGEEILKKKADANQTTPQNKI